MSSQELELSETRQFNESASGARSATYERKEASASHLRLMLTKNYLVYRR